MKKLSLCVLAAVLLMGTPGFPAGAAAATADRYPFQAGDLVCVRATASVYACKDGKWKLADHRSAAVFGAILDIQKVKVSSSRRKRTVRLYQVSTGAQDGGSVWVDDVSPTVRCGNQTIAYDAYKGSMTVDLTSSGARQAVLQNGLGVAQALREAQKQLGYGKYFKVKTEYFAWELIAHAYAAEFGLPEYSRSSVADCDVTRTDADTEFIIDVARALWDNGPEKTWV